MGCKRFINIVVSNIKGNVPVNSPDTPGISVNGGLCFSIETPLMLKRTRSNRRWCNSVVLDLHC